MLRHSLSSLAILSLVVGCSSDPAPAPATVAEAGTDSAVDSGTDTKKPVAETGPEPIACQEPVDEVVCRDPTKPAGGTACTDAMLTELAEKCLASDISVPEACAEWKTANAACATCVKSWSWTTSAGGPPGDIYPDDWLCYWSVMDAPCAKAASCMFECEYTACGNCESGTADRTKCFDTVSAPGGACYDLASKQGNECFETHKTALEGCNVDEIYEGTPNIDTLKQQVVRYLRGACRDGGNWTNAGSALDGGVSETGSDVGSDTAMTDSGSDTAVTDSGSDTATTTTDAADDGG